MCDGNYIKLSRKILEWEWYKDENTARVFIHCIIKANWEDGKYRGVEVPRGSFVSSYNSIANDLKLTVKSVRVAINHLIRTKEMASKGYSQFSVFTVLNYNKYQGEGKAKDIQRASKGQAKGNNRRSKEEKEVKNKSVYGAYRHVLLTDSEREELTNAYGEDMTSDAIDMLDQYIEMKGYKVKSHYLCIKKWVIDAVNEQRTKGKTHKNNRFNNFEQRKMDNEELEALLLSNNDADSGDNEDGG